MSDKKFPWVRLEGVEGKGVVRTVQRKPVHPLINFARRQALRHKVNTMTIGHASGLNHSAVSNWFNGRTGATVDSLEVLLNTFGYGLAPVPLSDVTEPRDLTDAELAQVTRRFKTSTQGLREARNERIYEMEEAGLNPAQIARKVGLTHQAVHKILGLR